MNVIHRPAQVNRTRRENESIFPSFNWIVFKIFFFQISSDGSNKIGYGYTRLNLLFRFFISVSSRETSIGFVLFIRIDLNKFILFFIPRNSFCVNFFFRRQNK
jgi:hypothetical protein